MEHFLFLGSHSVLALAEARTYLPGQAPTIIGPIAIFHDRLHWNGTQLQHDLAGTIKLGNVLFSCAMNEVTPERIIAQLPHRQGVNKLTFSLTILGKSPTAQLRQLPLHIKRALQASTGRSVRWFVDSVGNVSSAAVHKLGLANEGYDLTIAIDHTTAHVCLTTHVQNPDEWSQRDYGRPARDPRNGMLPPKLARMMVNLALANHDQAHPPTILDPFCGSGTVLMEALLCKPSAVAIGSDIDAKQITDSRQNLQWLKTINLISAEQLDSTQLFICSAQSIIKYITEPVDAIVTEGSLGAPLLGHEPLSFIAREADHLSQMWTEVLLEFAKIQTTDGTIVCVWPILCSGQEKILVDMTNTAQHAGYKRLNILAGWPMADRPLVYARPDQLVQRQIVILKKVTQAI